MADPYWRYAAERDSQTAFPGYLSENSASASRGLFGIGDLHSSASDYLHKDKIPSRPGIYDLDGLTAAGATPASGGLPRGAGVRRFAPLEDTALVSHEAKLGTNLGITEREHSTSLRKSEGPHEESSMLFVDGLPNDCSRREVSHLFRPFIGFKEIRVIHKESRRTGEKARVLCFVEFTDAKCARVALEALQGYKFDDSKPDAPPALKIQFAHFPLRPSVREAIHGSAH